MSRIHRRNRRHGRRRAERSSVLARGEVHIHEVFSLCAGSVAAVHLGGNVFQIRQAKP
jgi:hypothetical protein